MALTFSRVGYAYGREPILDDVDLVARPGALTCLLGESGSGKTTLLRLAAGLVPMQRGEIRLDGERLCAPGASPPPERRPVGLLFQEGALFPHMTVAANVAYGLKDRASSAPVVQRLLGEVGLEGFGPRYPHTLSGGQQQRVALARALGPQPRVLLMDEPFASIDIVRRQALRDATRRVLADQDCIAILVTHDPEEAMVMADHIAILEEGRVVQAGTPEGLYDAPASKGVARLIGGGTEIEGQVDAGRLRCAFGNWAYEGPEGPVTILLRSAPVRLVADPDGPARVTERRLTGVMLSVTLQAKTGQRVTVTQTRGEGPQIGESVRLVPGQGALHVFPPATENQ